jgi:preprotein translocase subunit SecY
MTTTIIGSIVRTVLAAAGGAGLVSAGEIQQLIGAVSVLITVGWSIAQKIQAQRQAPPQ